MDHPEGIWVGRVDPGKNLEHLATEDGRVCLLIPELLDEMRDIEPEKEEAALAPDHDFPLILMAGRHIVMNANTLMRDPAWVEGKRGCTLAMHPDDADALRLGTDSWYGSRPRRAPSRSSWRFVTARKRGTL